jgi:cytochrome c oxidase subunit 2
MDATLPDPLGYFLHSAGPASRPTLYLGWVFGGISALVCIVIALLLVAAIFHRRAKADSQAIGREGDGLSWLYIGTGISTVILLGMTIYALITLNDIARPVHAADMTITVTGYDWWWKVDYDSKDPTRRFTTANEIHIPVGVPVRIDLASADVIHAFWVPLLAGKTQMIPGQTNRQWIEADQPGVYRGQCTQFCGMQHAHMAFEVIAQTPADFEKWRQAQLKPATASASAGEKLFQDQCSGCHMVRGTAAQGEHAPDLTHLASRQLIAAGTLPNDPASRMNWIAHVQEIKPGARMPDFALSATEAADLSTYLSTLE